MVRWCILFKNWSELCEFNHSLGSTMVPILWLNSHNSLQFLNKIHQRTIRMWLYSQTWYPKWYPKKLFEKFTFWAFQRRANHVYSHTRSKVTYRSVFMIFWYSIEFSKISLFFWNYKKIFNLHKDAQTHPDFMKTRAIRRLKAFVDVFYSKIEVNYVNSIIVWVPLWYPKNLCCQFWIQSLQILYLTCNNEMFARFH